MVTNEFVVEIGQSSFGVGDKNGLPQAREGRPLSQPCLGKLLFGSHPIVKIDERTAEAKKCSLLVAPRRAKRHRPTKLLVRAPDPRGEPKRPLRASSIVELGRYVVPILRVDRLKPAVSPGGVSGLTGDFSPMRIDMIATPPIVG